MTGLWYSLLLLNLVHSGGRGKRKTVRYPRTRPCERNALPSLTTVHCASVLICSHLLQQGALKCCTTSLES